MNKVKIFIIGSIVIFILIVFFILSLLNRRGTITPPITTITPTPIQFDQSQLFITSIIPADTTTTYLPAQPIEITFTQAVEKGSLRYSVTPPTEVLVNIGSSVNSLIISPLTVWARGETSISILSQTISASGNILKNPQNYILKTAIPTLPQHLEGAY